jgi:hypothetical protein
VGGGRFDTGVARERDDARRLVDLLEPAHDLGVLDRQALGRERSVGRLGGDLPDLVEPAAHRHSPRSADIAPIDVGRPVADEHGVNQGPIRQMPLTKDCVNESHGWTSS